MTTHPTEQHLLDKHYPHYCCKEMGGCGKRLWFEELVLANSNLKYLFENKIWKKTREELVKVQGERFNVVFLSDLFEERLKYKVYKYLKKLWKNKHVEFLCCNCYARMTQPKFKGKSILQDSVEALSSWMTVIQSYMIEEFSRRFGNINRNEHQPFNPRLDFIDECHGAPRGEPNDDDPQLKDYLEWLKDDISEGTGIPREELFGERDDYWYDELGNRIEVHPDNAQVVSNYPHIVVYSFTEGGACPNCHNILRLNEFQNYECETCRRRFLRL